MILNTRLINTAFLFQSLFVFSSLASAGTIHLPQTGQSATYSIGDDGDIPSGVPWPTPRFSSGGFRCLTDNLTGLTWAQSWNVGRVPWNTALAAIVAIEGMYGHTDWRLPNVNELATLLNANETNSAAWLNAGGQGFSSVQEGTYWTSTTDADLASRAWTVDMIVGVISGYNKTSNSFYVMAVRGTTAGPALVAATGQTVAYGAMGGEDGDLQKGIPLPSTRFQVNGDGTATDALTGLVWLQDANCIKTHYPTFDNGGVPASTGQVIWERALDFVDGMNNGLYPLCNVGGYSDWRLPNKNELRSLINYQSYSTDYFASLVTGYGFSNIQSNHYWSSTTSANDPVHAAWTLYTWGNTLGTAGKTVSRYLWPVRSTPNIQVTPQTFDFGAAYVWDTKIKTFAVSNEGSADLSVYSLALPGADFTTMNDHCSGALLRPSETCSVDAAFRPFNPGSATALFEMSSNDTIKPILGVFLYGFGRTDCSYLSDQGVQIINGYCVPFPTFSHICDTIQNAYNNATAADTIKVRMISFAEHDNLGLGKTVTLEGGYDCMFLESTYYSTINGSLTITSGQVTISNIVIQ